MKSIKISSLTPHNRSCVPCALSTILDTPYQEVNNWLKYHRYRRGDNSGTFTERIPMKQIGLEKIRTDFIGKSVNQFITYNPKGTFLVRVRGHCLSVKDGIAFDTGNSEKRRVLEVWKKIEDKLPSDWNYVQQFYIDMVDKKTQAIKKQQTIEKRKQYYKERKKKIKEQKKTVEHKVAALLKRKKSWETRLKRAKTTLSGIERKLKYYQRKQTKS